MCATFPAHLILFDIEKLHRPTLFLVCYVCVVIVDGDTSMRRAADI
jgi:hypothetical protein